jgi:hypothetical protein
MPIVRFKSPIGKAVGGIFFGCLSLVILIGPSSAGSMGARMFLTALFGLTSVTLFSSGYKHQKYLQSRSDELGKKTGL